MAFARVSKLKTVSLLICVVTLFILLTLLTNSVFEQKLYCTSDRSPQPTQQKIQLLSDIPENNLRGEIHNINLRSADVAESIEELDYLLNIRKLILFAVHKLNEPLKYTTCTKWWANPLDLVTHKKKLISTTHAIHSIKLHIQPGNLLLVVMIRQQMPPIGLEDTELEIVGSFEIQGDFQGNRCLNEPITNNVAKTCLCNDHENFKEYDTITTELRRSWDRTDVELRTWHPDKSFSVTDYMNFTDYEWFVTSPGHTIHDVAKFRYSTEYCGPDIKMLVMISSAPDHFEHRKVIRNTYAHSSNLDGKGIKVVFLMGIPTDEKLNDDVKWEAEMSKDIIQANFEDSYHNLTISHLSMYKWAHLTCIEGKNSGVTVPQFILKADDDFLLNLDLALEVAQQNFEYEFIGCLFCGGKAVRNLAYMTKYYTPRYMHISNSYAGYLSGVVYVMRTDVIPLLLHMSITTPIIHMDDAYVTGILLRQLSLVPINSDLFTYVRIDDPDACKFKQVVGAYVLDLADMIAQWNVFTNPILSNCTMKDLTMKVRDLTEGDKRACFFV